MKHLLSAITAISLFWIAPAGAQDKLTIMLDWFVNPDHAPLIVAQEKGYFKSSGLKVKMIAPADPNDPPKLVAAGKVDLAVSYQPQLHVQVSEGLPLARIGTLVSTPLNSLVALEGGPIKSIKDLKGKKIVLYFYPKDMTPGCTTEAEGFRDAIKEFKKSNDING